MNEKKALRLLLISFTLLMLTLSFQGSASAADVTQLSMGTATVGGFFYDVGAPVAQCINKALPEVNVTAEFTEGSTENLRLIGQKKMQLGVISPMIGRIRGKVVEKNAPYFTVDLWSEIHR